MRSLILAALCAFTAAGAAHGQDAGPCAKFKWSVERERAWIAAGPAPVTAEIAPNPAPNGRIALDERAYRVTLAAGETVKFVAPPERAAKPGTHAGLLNFTVAKPGAYDVGLSGEGWIDVIQDGAAIKSSDFSGVKDCPGLRKSVRFPLAAGVATLQLSNIEADTVDIAIAPAP